MMDTRRLILFFVFSFSLFLLWEAWQKEQHAQQQTAAARRRVATGGRLHSRSQHRCPAPAPAVRQIVGAAELPPPHRKTRSGSGLRPMPCAPISIL